MPKTVCAAHWIPDKIQERVWGHWASNWESVMRNVAAKVPWCSAAVKQRCVMAHSTWGLNMSAAGKLNFVLLIKCALPDLWDLNHVTRWHENLHVLIYIFTQQSCANGYTGLMYITNSKLCRVSLFHDQWFDYQIIDRTCRQQAAVTLSMT